MIACPSVVFMIFMNSSPTHVAVNVLPSGCVNVWLPGLAGLALSWSVNKMTNIDKKLLILMLFAQS